MSTFPPPVPKPVNAGMPMTAIANTRQAFINVRSGPGTQYRDIGDLRNYTLVAHFPATRTPDGWVWIEQRGQGGWVSISQVNFEQVAGAAPVSAQVATPYDGKAAIWHWKGDGVGENTIDELARSLKQNAPHITQVWVKTSDYTKSAGAQWMGYWDTKRNLAIDGPASIDRWVQVLGQYGLEFHAWCVPRGLDINAEAELIIQACKRPGVKSMILDIEPYAEFWQGGQAAVRPFMTKIRRALPGSFHIGICVDPRSHHYNTIFPKEWAPFINSVHPMVYWRTMRRQPDELLQHTWEVWGGYGKPIIPALQGNAEPSDIETAITLSTKRHGAPGISWWRMGVIGPVEFSAINRPLTGDGGTTPTPPTSPRPIVVYTDEQIIKPGDNGYTMFNHTGQNQFQDFRGTWGWTVYYKQTEAQSSKTAVRWTPRLGQSGKWEIAAFVPARHATTRNARYKIHGVKGVGGEVIVTVDQYIYHNQWVSLGVFEFDRTTPNAATVFLNDLTGERDKEIAFDAMRWRRAVLLTGEATGPIPPGFVDGFDSPVGTPQERRSVVVWPGRWLDASPFGKLYFVGTPSEAYHTGADLNLPQDADAHGPVYATASGVVVFAARLPTWGNIIIIKHDPMFPSGLTMYSRYGHVEEMMVTVGQRVTRGQQICKVGNAFGRWAYHLHFDLSPTSILEANPAHWPGKKRDELLAHYVDPKEFIQLNRPKR